MLEDGIDQYVVCGGRQTSSDDALDSGYFARSQLSETPSLFKRACVGGSVAGGHVARFGIPALSITH